MKPREIMLSEIRTGDRIRWEHCEGAVIEGTVEAVRFDGREVAVIGIGWASFMRGAVTLLDRPLPPLPPLPTDEGTVVGNRERMMTLVRRESAWWYGDAIYQNDEAGQLDPSEWVLLGEVSA